MAQSACRLLYYTSLAFGTTSYTALELVNSGLNTSQDDALAVCIANPAYQLDLSSFKLHEVLRGGSQFRLSEARDWRIDHTQPVTLTSLPHLLRQDSLLAASPRPAWCALIPPSGLRGCSASTSTRCSKAHVQAVPLGQSRAGAAGVRRSVPWHL